MANVYVRSGAGGAGTGADWANAYTTLAAALTAKAAGDDFWVSEDHAETQTGAMTLTCPGTAGTPCRIICVDHTGTVPPVSADLRTTATISTTTTGTITATGFYYCYGIIFSAGNGANSVAISLANTAGNSQTYEACAIRIGGTTGGNINLNVGTGVTILNNTTIQVAAVGSGITARGKILWRNTAAAVTGATVPTTLFGTGSGIVYCEAVDFIGMSTKTLVPNQTAASNQYTFKDCKLPASITVAAAQTGGPNLNDILVVRCDSGATNYRQEKHGYAGVLTTETTITRTGGATDGGQLISWKVVTNAGSKLAAPFDTFPIQIWNASTSSITVTVYGIWGGGAVPTDADIWLEAEYLGDAATPQGSFATNGKANPLATNANQSADGSTWGGSTTAFKMALTFTPAQAGPITLRVRCAAATTTFYIDPKPEISGVTVSKSYIGGHGTYINELSTAGAPTARVIGG